MLEDKLQILGWSETLLGRSYSQKPNSAQVLKEIKPLIEPIKLEH